MTTPRPTLAADPPARDPASPKESNAMDLSAVQRDTLRRMVDRALDMGDHVSEVNLRRRLCASCGLLRTACLASQRRSCQPVAARVA